jgi:hypothetical protein
MGLLPQASLIGLFWVDEEAGKNQKKPNAGFGA